MGRVLQLCRFWAQGSFFLAVLGASSFAAATDVRLVGSEGYSALGNVELLYADQVHNYSASGVSGQLRLELWATPAPFTGSFAGGYQTGGFAIGTVAAGASLTNLESGVLPMQWPPLGLWYVALVLTEYTGAPTNGGYSSVYYARFADQMTGLGSPPPPPPPDTTPPTSALVSPTGGSVSGTVTISATASDNVGVTRVDFYISGSLVGSSTTAPYQHSWNTTSSANGGATLQAVAYDAAGNSGRSSIVSVTVANGPPPDTIPPTVSIVSPDRGNVAGSITITANASDNVGVTRVDFYVNGSLLESDMGAPWQVTWNTTKAANGTATLIAVAYDAAGNSATSAAVSMTVSNPGTPPPPGDSTPPTAAIASPTGGSVSGVVPVGVNASDNVGVVRVDLLANGHVVATDSAAPWQFSWNSAGVPNGTAQLQAVAYDASGNAGTSPVVMVTVANAALPPTQASTTYAIEYYNATLDHYFMTAVQSDMDVLDSGAIAGWVRTGFAFKVYAQPAAGASPVCRIYIPPGYGDSHFFSASPTECVEAIERSPSFIFETADAFYIDTPDESGNCPTGDAPIYRLWNHRPDINHRYTTSWQIRQEMVAQGYIAEGYGPNAVMMCSPP